MQVYFIWRNNLSKEILKKCLICKIYETINGGMLKYIAEYNLLLSYIQICIPFSYVGCPNRKVVFVILVSKKNYLISLFFYLYRIF